MTIPGRGDLVPLHRHAPIGRYLTVVVVVALLAGGGYAAYQGLSGGTSTHKPQAQGKKCVATKPAGPANPHQVHVVVLNGTLTVGLATEVGDSLQARGFHIARVGNTPQLATGVATIRYPAGQLLKAQAVADQIGGATLTAGSGKAIELSVGPKFQALRSPAAAKQARLHFMATQPPASTPTAGGTCQPRS